MFPRAFIPRLLCSFTYIYFELSNNPLDSYRANPRIHPPMSIAALAPLERTEAIVVSYCTPPFSLHRQGFGLQEHRLETLLQYLKSRHLVNTTGLRNNVETIPPGEIALPNSPALTSVQQLLQLESHSQNASQPSPKHHRRFQASLQYCRVVLRAVITMEFHTDFHLKLMPHQQA